MNWDLSVSWTRTIRTQPRFKNTNQEIKKKKKQKKKQQQQQQRAIQHRILWKRPNHISLNEAIKSNNLKKKLQTQWKVER